MDPNAPPPEDAGAPPAAKPTWLQQIEEMMGGYALSDDDLMMLANFMMQSQMQQQVASTDYQFQYLDYLNRQLGLNEQQLGQAEKEMAFQQGPYWEWYTEEFFPMQQETAQVQAQSQQAIAGFEQERARDYALSSAYQTEQSRLGTEAARYQFLTQTMGVNPVRDPGSRVAYKGY